MAIIRTFIAFDTPEEFKLRLRDVQSELRGADAYVRWEAAEKFHVTVKFLGDTNEETVPAISEQITRVVSGGSVCDLTFDRIGFFPDRRGPNVVWAGCSSVPHELAELKREIGADLARFGFEAETRGFHPHITLGRIKSERNVNNLISRAEKINFDPLHVSISEFLLMKSVLRPGGSSYTVLQRFPFHRV